VNLIMQRIATFWTIVLGAAPLSGLPTARADVKLPALISDHMVLQAGVSVPIWGWAEAGEEVAVTLGETQVLARTGADGKWKATLPPLKAGGPHTLIVKGKNEKQIEDVLVGEVWLGSGQSNMAMTVNRALDFEAEAAKAAFPQIRMFTVTSGASPAAQEDCTGAWTVCSPEALARFSATAYFFGRELHQKLKTPVGLINSSVGGTPIESWISPDAQERSPELKAALAAAQQAEANFDPAAAKAKYERDLAAWQAAAKAAQAAGKKAGKKPQDPLATKARRGNVGGLYNGKIAPLVPYAIRGVIWYQGEANTMPGKAEFYQYQLPLLVQDWRARWGQELPFAWVQLPNFKGAGRDWPTVREAMLNTLALPKTGMAITIDVGEENDIHPKNKQAVGHRLALWALGTVYGQSGATSGPLPAGSRRSDKGLELSFKHADGGLVAKSGELRGFEIAGADGAWKPAQAAIVGDKVLVSSREVSAPTQARYAWTNFPDCNLFNGAGLPASPFRTAVEK
jgi:sialate O-acetylesterase